MKHYGVYNRNRRTLTKIRILTFYDLFYSFQLFIEQNVTAPVWGPHWIEQTGAIYVPVSLWMPFFTLTIKARIFLSRNRVSIGFWRVFYIYFTIICFWLKATFLSVFSERKFLERFIHSEKISKPFGNVESRMTKYLIRRRVYLNRRIYI